MQEATLPEVVQSATTPPASCTEVTLADGTRANLGGLSRADLLSLQWREERAFARQILDAPKGSPARAQVARRAYDTVTKIFALAQRVSSGPLLMGLHPRHQHLALTLLARQRRRAVSPSFFEIGYGSGALLKRLSDAGYPVAGIEVSPSLRQQACRLLGPSHESDLLLGDFLQADCCPPARYSLIYWNDVFEHVPPDEILDYLRRIDELLAPGGQLVTITPNWHVRPSDITSAFCPPRTQSAGVHLKEYTLREVTTLLRRAGFSRVATPLCAAKSRFVLCGGGLCALKCLWEPCLEFLPFRLATLLCRGFALDCTIASKAR